MKLDKRRWSHWCYLLLFSANIVLALLLRWWPGRASARTVVLYGHKFSGNLLAIFEQARADGRAQEFVFLTMDPAYHRELARQGLPSVLGTSPACIPVLARMRALISDHGLHSLELMRRFSGAKFFDVWHGIPFKGFDADDFRVQRTYDEVWVASPLLRDIYRQRFGFDGERLAVTGYARTDRLLAPREPLSAAREYVGLAADEMPPPSRSCRRSSPAQKARPTPVRITQRTAGSSLAFTSSRVNSPSIGPEIVFMRSGAFSVMSAIAPSSIS